MVETLVVVTSRGQQEWKWMVNVYKRTTRQLGTHVASAFTMSTIQIQVHVVQLTYLNINRVL